jgi:heme/copper-type cytochrome/quinol oxidase subunit 4
MTVDPKIKITLAVVLTVIAFAVAIDNYTGGDIRSGVVLTLIGIFFAATSVQHTRRFLGSDGDR